MKMICIDRKLFVTTMSLHILNFWSYGNEQFDHVPVSHRRTGKG